MDVALSVIGSLLRTDPPRNVVSVLRHIKATLTAIHDKTIQPRSLLRKVAPMLPDSFQTSIMKLLQDDELFEHIWDDIVSRDMPKTRCFCFSG
jgi:hypothetical protein